MFIQYHLDENVNPAVARGMRNRGIDVTTSVETGMNGASDEEQLAYALSAGRVMVTHDADLLRLHHSGQPHAGIAYVHKTRVTVGQIVLALVNLNYRRSAEDMIGQVEFLR